ncbi:DUF4156 domain-containing protein [Aliivibrio fischeri]|uniref:DUF4156 domain-containing protein n=3 Tax=Aliivibrio fischeri TaxID=668 RepID=A0A1E5AW96_ALIFS|nr:DUF4156 domain-containing protein [Aliivibrio fischeri]EHN70355.1 ubiquinone biosynthesis protein AarF [Aliivibrio fischeri SR5]MUJ26009.1 DUF4156 domain-containing protein [Aliivibrio fischeri]MUK27194.1 DUF4156 domain-containing protein [Aliivibrio fischeri]MUK31049.1 DUF4156 domain-containing protein [Aliivibrio fischeri]MUK34518.1 DUF4156 domain-containing protein [Aliivibrio fischeri]
MKKTFYSLLFLLVLNGCALTTKPMTPESSAINLYYNDSAVEGCQEVGTVTGSEGHWYTFFFITNKDLTIGAINDIKNEAQALGANSIVVHTPSPFNTSVTMFGSAYICP